MNPLKVRRPARDGNFVGKGLGELRVLKACHEEANASKLFQKAILPSLRDFGAGAQHLAGSVPQGDRCCKATATLLPREH